MLSVRIRLEGVQIICRSLRIRCCLKDGALIVLENLQP
jgi:hypothetical protein